MRTHRDDFRDDLAAYALGALPDLEATALERHVMGCEECAAELRRMRPTADALALAVEPHAASDGLRARIMETVREEAGVPAAAPAPPVRRSLLSRLLPRRPALASAAALAASAALVAGGFGIGRVTGDAEPEGSVLAAQVDSARLPSGEARLHSQDDLAVLRVSGLPRLTGSRVYVVWVDHGRGPVYGSSFNVRPDGTGEAAIADAGAVRALMVTREPTTAVRQPTEQPVITAEFDS